jgi:hypothetical protein
MQPIDPEYTKNSYKESDRIQNQLTTPLLEKGVPVSYEHQGSVTNNTHIKAHSDIDILVVHGHFYSLEPPQVPQIPYLGDPIEDLKNLRSFCIEIIKSKFPEVNVDTSGSKSVPLAGGSLKRKIDLVFCNWWDTNDYHHTRVKYNRGIHILDIANLIRIENKPFLHNQRLEEKDRSSNGNAKKLIRLLKSLIYDSELKNNLSSYDVAGTIYNMPSPLEVYGVGQELQLIQECSKYLHQLINDEVFRNGIEVPNGTRKVYGSNGGTLEQLKNTKSLVDDLLKEINDGLTRSFRKLEEARIKY